MLLHRAKSVRLSPATQRGAALIVALILLAVITMVGLAAIGTTILQNEAAANQYDRQIAFQAAEAALSQAQVTITSTATQATPAPAGIEDCSTPTGVGGTPTNVCLANPFNDPNVPSADINTVPASAFSTGPGAAMPPQYVIQYMGLYLAPKPPNTQIGGCQQQGCQQTLPNAGYYRITARSGNPTEVEGRAIVTLQSTFRN